MIATTKPKNPYGSLGASPQTVSKVSKLNRPKNPYGSLGPSPRTVQRAAAPVAGGPAPPRPPAPARPPSSPYSTIGDPLLQQVLGNNQRVVGEAQAQMTDQEKKSLLGFGSVEAARALFPNDPTLLKAVQNNPYSALSNIKNTYEGVGGLVNQMNEAENMGNLFFSSDRLNNKLPALARQRGGQEYDATQAFQNQIDSINSAYSDTRNQAAQAEIAARQAAAQRSVAAALASGYGPGAGSHLPGNPYQIPSPSMPYVPYVPTNPGWGQAPGY